MKTLPPIPPNNPRFETIGPLLFWIAPHPDSKKPGKIAINLEDDPNLEDWRSLIAADAEVAWRKEADRIAEKEREETDLELCHVYDHEHDECTEAAAAWRSWAEPESEENDHATT